MPLYEYKCEICGEEDEVLRPLNGLAPEHCGTTMRQLLCFPVMVKFKGDGGFPSRRKFLHGSAPYTTRSTKPWLSTDPNGKVNYLGGKEEDE